MTKHPKSILGLLLLLGLSGVCLAAEPLSEKALAEITAQGQEDGSREPSSSRSTSTVSSHNMSHTSLIIQGQSQTHLRGGAVNNAAGRNQIANGINVR
jgi:hypothetical protein